MNNRDEWLEANMNEYGEELTRLAYNYVKDWSKSEDIVQDVFITGYRCFNQFRGFYL